MKRRNFLKGLLVFGMVLVSITMGKSGSFAQKDYPNREIELIVTFAAGGMADLAFRAINDEMVKILGVPLVVINKAGAGGAIGAQYVSQAKPDGYTIMGSSQSSIVLLPIMQRNLPYKPSDLVPIARFVSIPQLFAVKKDAPWKTLGELIAYAKKNPGKLTCGTAGIGTGSHFLLEMLKIEAGVDIQHVPFKGGGEQHSAVLGGHVDSISTTTNPSLPLVKSGDLRALVAAEKIKQLPNVPTLAEMGYPKAALTAYVGCMGPKGIPKSVVDKITNALERAVKVPSVVKYFEETGGKIDYVAKEEFAREIEEDMKRLSDVVKKANIAVQ